MKKIIVIATALLLASTVAACERKEAKRVAKPLSQAEQVQKASNSKTLEERVYAIEQRNARIDANIRKARAAATAKPAQ